MKDRVFALLVRDCADRFDTLKQTLKDLGVETYSVETCGQARSLLAQVEPSLVFTDPSVSDGSWVDMVIAADKAPAPLNVIVVDSSRDGSLRESAIRGGAFDSIVAPFDRPSVAGVVTAAAQDVRRRREMYARAAIV